MKLLVLSIILFLGFAFAFSGDEISEDEISEDENPCSWETKEKCFGDFRNIYEYPEDLFLTKDELKKNCTSFFSTLQCLENYMDACPENVYENKDFEEVFGQASSLIDELCTEGSEFRNEYLKYSSCLKSYGKEIRSCNYDVYNKFDDLFGSLDLSLLEDADDFNTLYCMKQVTAIGCLMKLASGNCDIGAASVLRRGLIALERPDVALCFEM